MLWMLSLLGCLLVIILAIVAIRLRLKLRALKRKRQIQEDEAQQSMQDQRVRINRSIQIIAQGVLDDQLTLTEACIRIHMLLDSLNIESADREDFSAFYQLADATAHIPILEAWKQLSSKDKRRYEQEREKIEATYQDFVLDAAQRIKGRTF